MEEITMQRKSLNFALPVLLLVAISILAVSQTEVTRPKKQAVPRPAKEAANAKTTEVPLKEGSKLIVKVAEQNDVENITTYVLQDLAVANFLTTSTIVNCGCGAKVNGKVVYYWAKKECRSPNGNICHCETPAKPWVQCN
jgi:hypothetical protein